MAGGWVAGWLGGWWLVAGWLVAGWLGKGKVIGFDINDRDHIEIIYNIIQNSTTNEI